MKQQKKEGQEKRPDVLIVNRGIILGKSGGMLIVRRAADDSFHPGYWECAGGKLKLGEDVTHALDTEILQETGLTTLPLTSLAYMDSKIIAEGKYKGVLYLSLFFIVKHESGVVRLSNEHDDYAWLGYDEAVACSNLTPETHKALVKLEGVIRALM